MGRTKNGTRNRRTDIMDGFKYWWEDLAHTNQEKKELNKKPMEKQKVLDNRNNSKRTNNSRPVSKRRKGLSVASSVIAELKLKVTKGIDKLKVFVYNVYCSIAKRKDNKMAKDNKTTTGDKQSTNRRKAEKSEPNWFVSGIITIGIAMAWVSAVYCVVLVNTGTGNDMFPKYASAPLGLLLAGTFLVAIYKTIKNNNR